MKAEDLMVGDWIHLHYINKLEGEVHKNQQVSQIRNDYGELCVWSKECGNMGNGKNVEPIPLTSEILEKNGWKWNPNIKNYEWKNGAFYSCISEHNMMRIYVMNDYLLGICFCFVHELQHALKLCGIDKTIEI